MCISIHVGRGNGRKLHLANSSTMCWCAAPALVAGGNSFKFLPSYCVTHDVERTAVSLWWEQQDGHYLVHPGWLAPTSATAKQRMAKLLCHVCPSFSPRALDEAASSVITSHGPHPCQEHGETMAECCHVLTDTWASGDCAPQAMACPSRRTVWFKQMGLCGHSSQHEILPPAFKEQARDTYYGLIKFALWKASEEVVRTDTLGPNIQH